MSPAFAGKIAKERAPARSRRDTTINIRVESETRDLIDRAAAASGKTRSEFMVDVARRRAVDVLLDQRLFAMKDEPFEAFMNLLDDPPPPGPKLKALLRKKPLWEK